MSDASQDIIPWLQQSGYNELAALLLKIQDGWKARGVNTRRSWWVRLAGGKNGRPSVVEGHQLPVLKAAQRRMGVPVTANALSLPNELPPPPKRSNGRWKTPTKRKK